MPTNRTFVTETPPVVEEPAFEALNNHLRLEISHLRIGRFRAMTWENRIPERRLFLVHRVPPDGVGGSVASREARQAVVLRAGSSYLLPAGHRLRGTFADGLELVGVHFRLEAFPGADALPTRDRILVQEGAGALAAALVAWAGEATALARVLAVRALVGQALVPFLPPLGWGGHEDPALAGVTRLRTRYAPLLPVLERPSAADSVGTLARAMGLRRETLSRSFAADVGEPLKQVLTRQLARRASVRLAGSDDPIAAIARELGFSGASYFARFVRRHLGATPLAYRRARQRLPA